MGSHLSQNTASPRLTPATRAGARLRTPTFGLPNLSVNIVTRLTVPQDCAPGAAAGVASGYNHAWHQACNHHQLFKHTLKCCCTSSGVQV
jgi:hypothetical protein